MTKQYTMPVHVLRIQKPIKDTSAEEIADEISTSASTLLNNLQKDAAILGIAQHTLNNDSMLQQKYEILADRMNVTVNDVLRMTNGKNASYGYFPMQIVGPNISHADEHIHTTLVNRMSAEDGSHTVSPRLGLPLDEELPDHEVQEGAFQIMYTPSTEQAETKILISGYAGVSQTVWHWCQEQDQHDLLEYLGSLVYLQGHDMLWHDLISMSRADQTREFMTTHTGNDRLCDALFFPQSYKTSTNEQDIYFSPDAFGVTALEFFGFAVNDTIIRDWIAENPSFVIEFAQHTSNILENLRTAPLEVQKIALSEIARYMGRIPSLFLQAEVQDLLLQEPFGQHIIEGINQSTVAKSMLLLRGGDVQLTMSTDGNVVVDMADINLNQDGFISMRNPQHGLLDLQVSDRLLNGSNMGANDVLEDYSIYDSLKAMLAMKDIDINHQPNHANSLQAASPFLSPSL